MSSAAGADPAAGAVPAAGTVPTAGAVPVSGTGSGDAVGLNIGSSSSIEGVKMTFKPFNEINKEKEIILIISFIFSLKSLKIKFT